MEAFFGILLFSAPVILIIALIKANHADEEKSRVRAQLLAAEKAEKEAAQAKRLQLETEFLAAKAPGWPFHAKVKIEDKPGIVVMDREGRLLRLLVMTPTGDPIEAEEDSTFGMPRIRHVSVYQPTMTRTVVHTEKVPVGIVSTKGNGGLRAAAGGLVAGQVGATIGAASAAKVGTSVSYHEVQRNETVNYLPRAKLVLDIDDLERPRVSLEFVDHVATNEWLSRIHTAMQRRR